MSDTNKVRFGLTNVHVGALTFDEKGDPVFGIPKRYPGAVNFTMDPEGEQTSFYADDTLYYTSTQNNGYSGELEVAYLYDWFEKEFLGSSETEDGMMIETADDNPTPLYLMFQFAGDVHAVKHILYNVQCSRPSIEASTSEDTKEVSTTTIPFVSMPLQTPDGNFVKAKVSHGNPKYDDFFKTAPTLPVLKKVESEASKNV